MVRITHLQYLIQFVDQSLSDATWQPASVLKDHGQMVREFHDAYPDLPMHTRVRLTLPTNVDPNVDRDVDINSVSVQSSSSVLGFVPVSVSVSPASVDTSVIDTLAFDSVLPCLSALDDVSA